MKNIYISDVRRKKPCIRVNRFGTLEWTIWETIIPKNISIFDDRGKEIWNSRFLQPILIFVSRLCLVLLFMFVRGNVRNYSDFQREVSGWMRLLKNFNRSRKFKFSILIRYAIRKMIYRKMKAFISKKVYEIDTHGEIEYLIRRIVIFHIYV